MTYGKVTTYLPGVFIQNWSQKYFFIEFSTQFSDGQSINTLNTRVPIGLFNSPKTTRLHVWWIRSMLDLYRIHKQFIAVNRPYERAVFPLDDVYQGDCERFLIESMREEFESGVRNGVVRLCGDGKYRFALKGALFSAWQHLPPLSWFFWVMRTARNKRLLAKAGVQV